MKIFDCDYALLIKIRTAKQKYACNNACKAY